MPTPRANSLTRSLRTASMLRSRRRASRVRAAVSTLCVPPSRAPCGPAPPKGVIPWSRCSRPAPAAPTGVAARWPTQRGRRSQTPSRGRAASLGRAIVGRGVAGTVYRVHVDT
eukprot:scaffold105889_cov36-Phaeocystis_antarctica.AAC.2